MTTATAKPDIAGIATERVRLPPRWVLIGLGVALAGGLAALAWLPGGTPLDRLSALDAGICAQLPTHSFYPGGQQLPLCARNTGIYLSFALGVMLFFARGLGRSAALPRGWVALVLLGGIGLMAIDGFNSLFTDLGLPHLYQPDNLLRLATGLLTGTAMAAFLVPVANGLLWRDGDDRRAYPTPGKLALVVPILALAFAAVASQAAWLLYPIALLSTAGVVLALTLINLSLVVSIGRRVGSFVVNTQVAPVFALSLALALLELISLSLLKQPITHAMGG